MTGGLIGGEKLRLCQIPIFPSFPPNSYPPVVDMHESARPVGIEPDAALAGQRGEPA